MKKRCYLCGDVNPSTRDHVPPKGFFPEPRPSNLITVPCCTKCNLAFSREDEYMRLLFSSLLGRSLAGDHIWDNKVVPRSLKRLSPEIDELLRSAVDTVLTTDEGPTEAVAFQVDEQRVHCYMVRLVKGLLTHHHPDYDYSDNGFVVKIVPQSKANLARLSEYWGLLRFEQRGDGVFQYRHGVSDTKRSGLWMLTFFKAIMIVVGHSSPMAGWPSSERG